jgi:hypothetical protein
MKVGWCWHLFGYRKMPPLPAPVLELRGSEDMYPSQETIPDAQRYIDLPRCARTHLSTWNWGATDILPFKPAVAL